MSFVSQSPSAVSTTFTHAAGGAAQANLYDGSDTTPAADPAGLTASTKAAYDFGTPKQIERCRAITAPSNGFTNAATFNIEYSDTSLTAGFSVASTIVVPAGVGQAVIKLFTPVGSHRYWRIANPTGTLSGNAWLGELTFYTQTNDAGSYAVAGNAAVFTPKMLSSVASFTVTGSASQPTYAIFANVGSYVSTGNAALGRLTFVAAATSYAVAGLSVALTTKLGALNGAFSLSGNATTTLHSFAVLVGSYAVTGIDAILSRDFVSWVQRPFSENASWVAADEQAETWTPKSVPSNTWTTE